jgi:hypothetical protein
VCCLEKGKPEDAKQEFGEIEFGNDQESDILAPECQQAKDLISFPLFDVIHLGENLYHGHATSHTPLLFRKHRFWAILFCFQMCE